MVLLPKRLNLAKHTKTMVAAISGCFRVPDFEAMFWRQKGVQTS